MRTACVMGCVLALALAFAVSIQCTRESRGDDDDAGDDTSGAVGNPTQSACQSGTKDDGYTKEEVVNAHFSGGTLSVEHVFTCRNCGFAFSGTYLIAGNVIAVTEEDVSTVPAGCDCFFTVDYEIPGVQAGAVYTLRIYEFDEWEGASADPRLILEETLDLSAQTDFVFSLGENTCI